MGKERVIDIKGKERIIDVLKKVMSSEVIARQLGVSKRCVNYWLSGEKKPGKANLRKLECLIKSSSKALEMVEEVKKPLVVVPDYDCREQVKPSGKFLEVRKLDKPSIPEAWDYKKSLVAVKAIIYKWTHLSVSVAEELFIAREKLSAVGRPTKEDKTGQMSRLSWNDYCNELGVEKRTVNRWLKRFFGKSLLDEPEEKALSEPEEKDEKRPRESMLCCLAEHYDSKDPMWSQVEDCNKCPMLTLCRQLGEIIDKDPRFKKGK